MKNITTKILTIGLTAVLCTGCLTACKVTNNSKINAKVNVNGEEVINTEIALGAGSWQAAESMTVTDELQKQMNNIKVSFCINKETGRPDACLNDECVENIIRSIEVSNHVSKIAAIPFVREAMVDQQRRMGAEKGIVMDGRDIGTTVFPDAELKIFVTASAKVRAQRRYDELQQKGMPADFDEILKNVEERDYIDSHREVSPLRQAEDAILLDNSDMTIPQQNEWLMQQVEKALQ